MSPGILIYNTIISQFYHTDPTEVIKLKTSLLKILFHVFTLIFFYICTFIQFYMLYNICHFIYIRVQNSYMLTNFMVIIKNYCKLNNFFFKHLMLTVLPTLFFLKYIQLPYRSPTQRPNLVFFNKNVYMFFINYIWFFWLALQLSIV